MVPVSPLKPEEERSEGQIIVEARCEQKLALGLILGLFGRSVFSALSFWVWTAALPSRAKKNAANILHNVAAY